MRRSKILGLLVLIAVSGGMLVLGARWVHYRLTHAITNAVFVESDSLTRVAYRRVAGRIERLFKEEGDYVKRGEALAKVGDRDYRIRLEEVERNIESLEEEIEALRIQLSSSRREILESIGATEAQMVSLSEEIASLEAQIDLLKRDRERFEDLHRKGVIPSRKFEEVETQLRSLLHRRKALEARREQLRSKLSILRAKLEGLGSLERKIASLKKKLQALEKKREDLLNLIEETTLRSPIEGYVVKRYVSEGEVVRQGQFVYAVYDPKDLYILVLLEETKLKGVKEGSRVLIKIDAFPDERFEGVVEEIGRATAAKFALIPRDVTAGEFTKVAQRIPVRVRIVKGRKELLRVGMGGEVAIEKE